MNPIFWRADHLHQYTGNVLGTQPPVTVVVYALPKTDEWSMTRTWRAEATTPGGWLIWSDEADAHDTLQRRAEEQAAGWVWLLTEAWVRTVRTR